MLLLHNYQGRHRMHAMALHGDGNGTHLGARVVRGGDEDDEGDDGDRDEADAAARIA